jgi:hypothetical protein
MKKNFAEKNECREVSEMDMKAKRHRKRISELCNWILWKEGEGVKINIHTLQK